MFLKRDVLVVPVLSSWETSMPIARDTSHINWSDHFIYDESSFSCLRRKFSSGGIVANSEVGCLNRNGYYHLKYKSIGYKVHRVIWEMFNGPLSIFDKVDHIDGNPLNNKISNLRAGPESLNIRNRKMLKNNTTGFAGVSTGIVNGYKYHMAYSRNLDGKQTTLYFPIHKYGPEEAFKMAYDARVNMLNTLNSNGAGYTERHGTL